MAENWKQRDIAICIDNKNYIKGSIAPPLRLNAEYIVNKIKTCECGSISLDVGLPTMEDSSGVECFTCGAKSSPKSGVHWARSTRFKKKKTRSIEEQIADAVEIEDFETAAELQKQVKV